MINSIFGTLGTLDYYIYTLYSPYFLIITILLKNMCLPAILLYISRSNDYIIQGERNTDLVSYSHLSTVTYNSIFQLVSLLVVRYVSNDTSIGYEVLLFIPNTFIFEVGFDFFHYIVHRLLHANPLIYRLTHKYHHQDYTISILTTFHHTIADLLLTNLLPLVFTAYIYPLPLYTYIVWLWYKTLIEMGGHSGKYGKSSSFTQCIWIPRILGIEMYSDNHNMHHTNPGCNFSKRFALWDKIFGTFRDGFVN